MTYCTSENCLHIWHVCDVSLINKFKVCLSNAVRVFFGYDRFCSASAMYACEEVHNFDAMNCKASWKFLRSLCLKNKTRFINPLVQRRSDDFQGAGAESSCQ